MWYLRRFCEGLFIKHFEALHQRRVKIKIWVTLTQLSEMHKAGRVKAYLEGLLGDHFEQVASLEDRVFPGVTIILFYELFVLHY